MGLHRPVPTISTTTPVPDTLDQLPRETLAGCSGPSTRPGTSVSSAPQTAATPRLPLQVDTPAGTRRVVLEAGPDGDGDGVDLETRLQRILAEHTAIPVPTVFGAVDESGVDDLPTPFVCIAQVPGRAVERGAVGDLSGATVEGLARASGRYLAELHGLDAVDGFGFLAASDSPTSAGVARRGLPTSSLSSTRHRPGALDSRSGPREPSTVRPRPGSVTSFPTSGRSSNGRSTSSMARWNPSSRAWTIRSRTSRSRTSGPTRRREPSRGCWTGRSRSRHPCLRPGPPRTESGRRTETVRPVGTDHATTARSALLDGYEEGPPPPRPFGASRRTGPVTNSSRCVGPPTSSTTGPGSGGRRPSRSPPRPRRYGRLSRRIADGPLPVAGSGPGLRRR